MQDLQGFGFRGGYVIFIPETGMHLKLLSIINMQGINHPAYEDNRLDSQITATQKKLTLGLSPGILRLTPR